MQVVFDLREVEQDWQPPFKKKINERTITVSKGERFCPDESGRSVFKLIKVVGKMALVEFDDKFTVKGHEHPESRQVWVDQGEFKVFSALWSNKGVSKKLRVKEVLE